MSNLIELTDGIPPAATDVDDADDVMLYGSDLANPGGPAAGRQRVLAYGFCFQGHCYRLAMPVEFAFGRAAAAGIAGTPAPVAAMGCGYDGQPSYWMWKLEKTDVVKRIERRKGRLEELLLDFNLPGRSPATLTYSAKVGIAGRAGKVYE